MGLQDNPVSVEGALATYEVTEQEVLTTALFGQLVVESRKFGALHLDVLIPPERIATDRTMLENNGFVWLGTAQVNRENRSVTLVRFRACVKVAGVAGDGVTTFGNTTLPPTSDEQKAVEAVKAKFSVPLSEARLAELAALGKQDEPAPTPDPIIENMKAEIARLEAEMS